MEYSLLFKKSYIGKYLFNGQSKRLQTVNLVWRSIAILCLFTSAVIFYTLYMI